MVTVAVLCSGWFVRPIAKSIAAVCSDAAEAAEQTGILEIDDLLSLIRSKTQSTGDDSLPDNIAELFDDFAARAALLTTTERSIVRYYAEGKEVAEVAELAFVSIHTVRRHNANIYHKLGVGARDELMLYIELFRRCGRLDEILESRESLPEK